jgi:hypothetical protein
MQDDERSNSAGSPFPAILFLPTTLLASPLHLFAKPHLTISTLAESVGPNRRIIALNATEKEDVAPDYCPSYYWRVALMLNVDSRAIAGWV